MPSRTSAVQASSVTTGFRHMALADRLTRAMCRSRSGVTPSNARAPSNTEVQSQAPCVRGPMIGTLPSCQSSSKNVQVFDQTVLGLAMERRVTLFSCAMGAQARSSYGVYRYDTAFVTRLLAP